MVVVAPVVGDVGQHLWVEVPGFGLVRCEIDDIREDGFVCRNLIADEAQKRLTVWVSWLRRRGGRSVGDQRRFARTRPRDGRTTLTVGGEVMPALLQDISRSGAAVISGYPVAMGQAVMVGTIGAIVVRTTEDGFAIAFDRVLEADEPDRLLSGYEAFDLPATKAG